MRAISVSDLENGMILARTIVNAKRVVVVSENTELTAAHIMRLKFLKIPVVYGAQGGSVADLLAQQSLYQAV